MAINMTQVWFYHHKIKKRVYVTILGDIWPKKFREFAEVITKLHEKITDTFSVYNAAQETGIEYETAKRYLEILTNANVVKLKHSVSENSYILTCTLPEEKLAEREIEESQIAAGSFHFTKRFVGFFRPWHILPSLELSWEEKLELLGKWYEEYWPEVHAILCIGVPLVPMVGTIIVNEANKNRAPEGENHGVAVEI